MSDAQLANNVITFCVVLGICGLILLFMLLQIAKIWSEEDKKIHEFRKTKNRRDAG
jgi:hypothetical protein